MTAMRTMGLTPVLAPETTVKETSNEYVVSLAVPGFAQQELEVELAGHLLTIRADQTRTAEDSGSFKLHEHLEESFRLPKDVATEHVTANYTHGGLEIHAPRTNGPPPRRKIPIARRTFWNADASPV